MAQLFDQSEQTVRLPAALFGALTAPARVYGVWRIHGKVTPLTAVAAIAAALSPVLIRHSREVSEVTLFGLLLVLLVITVMQFARSEGHWRGGVLLAGLCAVAFWTYYLASFALVACAAATWWLYRPARRFWLWFGVGVALGAPSLALGYRALVADRTARAAAAAQPGVAWGARDAAEVLGGITDVLGAAIGGLLVLFIVTAVWSFARRKPLGAMASAMAIGLLLAVVGLAPIARIQPYYIVVAIPLILLAIAAIEWPLVGQARRLITALAAGLSVAFVGAQIASVSSTYTEEDGAFMAHFADEIVNRGDGRVATVAHYDTTLLAYYLAREQRVRLRADKIHRNNGGVVRVDGLSQEFVPLVQTHAPNQDPDWLALSRLRNLAQARPILLVHRDTVRLPQLESFIASCEILEEAVVARLLGYRYEDIAPRPRSPN